MAEHARLSPSGYPRWSRCAASAAYCEDIVEERTSEYAAEGTCAHEVRADCLDLGLDAIDFLGQKRSADGFTFEVTEDMADALQGGIDWLREQPGEMFVEHRVNLDRWLPGQFGTLDCGICSPKLIIIDDLKFGMGIPVSPVENEQLRIYALGFWENIARHRTDATDFLISIDQPRNARGGGYWKTDLAALLEFGKEVEAAGKRTYGPDRTFTPGEKQCFWCSGQDSCEARAGFMLDVIGQAFDDIDDGVNLGAPLRMPRPASLTPERRSFLVQHAKMVEQWFDKLHDDTLRDALNGEPTPGLKAVEGRRGRREWRQENIAEARLKRLLADKAYIQKLASPAQAQKAAGKELWERIEPLVAQPSGKPVLVSADDVRPALKTVDEKFSDDDTDPNS